MVKDNFFSRPVGAAVLFLNDFHFGANLDKLNRAARLVPKDVKGFASIVSMMSTHEFESNAEHVSAIIDELVFVCNEIEPQ